MFQRAFKLMVLFGFWAHLAGLPNSTVFGQQDTSKRQKLPPQIQAVESQAVWTHRSKDDLYFQCAGKSSEQRKTCFDLATGDKINDLIPIRDVSDSEKTAVCDYWEKVLRPACRPPDEKQVEWRRVALTEVSWRPARPNRKDAHPPTRDWIFA
jgi:hypothetical protein